jgi:hypothetical protein
LRAGGGAYLSSAEAAELLRTGTPATATITGATRVDLPGAMLPGTEASLLDLEVVVRHSHACSIEITEQRMTPAIC